jgi:hypothetical protein
VRELKDRGLGVTEIANIGRSMTLGTMRRHGMRGLFKQSETEVNAQDSAEPYHTIIPSLLTKVACRYHINA